MDMIFPIRGGTGHAILMMKNHVSIQQQGSEGCVLTVFEAKLFSIHIFSMKE